MDISFKSLVYTFVLILEGYLSFINLLFRPLIPLFCLLWILEVIVDHTVRMLITCIACEEFLRFTFEYDTCQTRGRHVPFPAYFSSGSRSLLFFFF